MQTSRYWSFSQYVFKKRWFAVSSVSQLEIIWEKKPLKFYQSIIKIGSSLQITRNQWRCARAQGRCTSMATCLLTALVPKTELLKSNCEGGKAKICKNPDDAPHHSAIAPEILAGIKCKRVAVEYLLLITIPKNNYKFTMFD